MGQISVNVSLPAAADEVWQVVKDFGGASRWLPGIDSLKMTGSGVGAVRTVTYKDGSQAVERLESLSDDSRSLSFTILESSLPLEGYVASLTVRDLGPRGCEVEWYSTFGPKGATESEVTQMLEKSHRLALGNLQKSLKR